MRQTPPAGTRRKPVPQVKKTMEVDMDSSTVLETTYERLRETTSSCCWKCNLRNHNQLEWVRFDYWIRWFHSPHAKVQQVARGVQERDVRCPTCHRNCIVGQFSLVHPAISCRSKSVLQNRKRIIKPKKFTRFYQLFSAL
ncbi:hypothetical protein X801_08065, partial [Opisthorchis viverrini]